MIKKQIDRLHKIVKGVFSILFRQWNRPNRESMLYVGMLFVTIFGLLFIVSSRALFGDDSVMIDTGIGQQSIVEVGTTEVMIVKKAINSDTNYGEVIIRVDQPVTEVGITYEAIVGENETKGLVKSKLSKIHDQYYLLKLEDIPEKWKQLVVDFGYTSVEKPKLNTNYDVENVEEILEKKEKKTEQATFIFDYRKMENNKKLAKKSMDDYIIQVTEIEMKNVDKLLKKIEEDSEILDKEIQLYIKKIQELDEQKAFQTEEQQKQTDEEKDNVRSEISSYETAVKNMKKQSENLKEKKQKLIERNRQSKYLGKKD